MVRRRTHAVFEHQLNEFKSVQCSRVVHDFYDSEAAGALKVTNAPVKPSASSVHLLGTCRMGNDPATSVVDRYHRSHDIPNLFLCDGSSLVTSGRGQPTLTIQALAFRAAEHIANFDRRNEV